MVTRKMERPGGLHNWPRRTHKVLTHDQEVQLSLVIRSSCNEALSTAVASPGGALAAATLRAQVKSGADLWKVVHRTHGTEGKRLTDEVARQRFIEWCLRVEGGADSTEPGILEGALWLTEGAREILIDWACKSLSVDSRTRLQECLSTANKARVQYVYSNQGLVIQQATRYQFSGLSLSDLVQEGNLGLLRAIDKFDPELGCRFSTYAIWWIRQSMRRGLSNQSRMIRLPVHAYEDQLALRYALEDLKCERSREPTNEELSKRTGLSADKVNELLALVGEPYSLDVSRSEDGVPLGERLQDDSARCALGELVRKVESKNLRSLLEDLSERERGMLEMRFGLKGQEEHTLRQVGEQFGVTRERVRQIINGALVRLRGRAGSEILATG